MNIIRMITTHDESKTANMVCGPEIPLNFSEGGSMDTRRPLDFYTDHETFEADIRYQVDEEIKQYMYTHGLTDYCTAMKLVFAANPDLKKAYARS